MNLKEFLDNRSKLNKHSFGTFIAQRRSDVGLTLRQLASMLKISPAYLCDIEKGNRNVPAKIINQLKEILLIDDENKEFEDMAYLANGTCAPDLIQYLIENKEARYNIRIAIKNNVSSEEHLEIAEHKRKTQQYN